MTAVVRIAGQRNAGESYTVGSPSARFRGGKWWCCGGRKLSTISLIGLKVRVVLMDGSIIAEDLQ